MWSPNPRSTMRSVNSTAAFNRSGYWNSGRSSRISGHWSNGGRLSRVKVSTCAEGPSLTFAISVTRSRQGGTGNHDLLDVGGAFVDSESANFAVQRFDRMAGAHTVAAMKLHGGVDD